MVSRSDRGLPAASAAVTPQPRPTPRLVLDRSAVVDNLALMMSARPGPSLRPHVKAFKSTALARLVADAGVGRFCCATLKEMEGMVAAGLDGDLLLANETLDRSRLAALAERSPVTIAVDSDETLGVAVAAGVRRVVVDVNVGLPRCGCPPSQAPRLAAAARAAGLEVRGVMGYEGHVVGVVDRAARQRGVEEAMAILLPVADEVGGELVSVGGTGTYDLHPLDREVQAGSFLLMDTAYAELDLPFRTALTVEAAVLSVNPDGYAVADAGLKAFGMDHGNPTCSAGPVWFCSDEHTTFGWSADDRPPPVVGDVVRFVPAHVDPTVAYHEAFVVVEGSEDSGDGVVANGADRGWREVDEFAIDLRGW